jgi:hypothetical protein
MAAILPRMRRMGQGFARRWRMTAGAVLALGLGVVLVSWWFTEPLDDNVPGTEPALVSVPSPDTVKPPESRPAWPEGRLDGPEAKALLLAIVEGAARRIDQTEGYTATFRKQERVGGKLLPEQTLAMKVRQRPFAVYLKFLAPKPGKEVIYADGHHGNKVIAHNGDWTRKLIPRIAVDPTSTTALAENRHPITEAGLSNLAHKLLDFRKLDMDDPEAVTILDRTVGPDGRPWCRAIHLHPITSAMRPFGRVEVIFDPESLLPLRISSYETSAGEAVAPLLVERYAYDDLILHAPLGALDFDPANPEYAFLRY